MVTPSGGGTDETFVVSTQYGPVRGRHQSTLTGDVVYSFRGIPYARPPVGSLRFRDPQPPDPWNTPLDATQPIISAPKLDAVTNALSTRSSEDCLHLNVYTKRLSVPSADRRPVMFWLHGGGFKTGSSSDSMYGPDFLLRRDVVLVTINYRLGAFGFLSLDAPDSGVPGNAGLKDQTLALRWVRKNIGEFGGDASNVTVFGNSAGGCSVHLHMLSEHSAGAFDKAIAQSGTALAEWANYPRNNWARRLAERLGWAGAANDTDASVLSHLQAVDAADILRHQDAILTMDEKLDGITTFGPATEPYVSEHCFMPDSPVNMARRQRPWSVHVPLIIGGNADEGLLFHRLIVRSPLMYQSEAGFERTVPFCFGIARGTERSRELAALVRREYYGDEEPSADNVLRTLQIWGDKVFWHGIGGAVRGRLRTDATAPMYLYRFAVETSTFDWHKRRFAGADVAGTSHVDEVVYLFKHDRLDEMPASGSLEMATIDRMTEMWTNFAVTGNPNGEALATVQWKPILDEAGPLQCLHIADGLTFGDLPEVERIQFWDRLYAEYGGENYN